MPEHVNLDFFQWVIGLLLTGNIALFGWVAKELAQLRRDQAADRKASVARSESQDAHHDNDLRDLWQVLNEHRRDSDLAARKAGDFRERVLETLGDVKASLAHLSARLPPHPAHHHTAPGD